MIRWGSAAALVWILATVAIASAHWSMSCNVHGQELGGIDCLQAGTLPRTDTEPIASIGFLPLAIAWLVASAGLAACALEAGTRRLAR